MTDHRLNDTKPFDPEPPFSRRHRIHRLAWGISWIVLAAWTPKFFRPWRIALLRLFGAQIGNNVDVRGSARVWYPPNLRMDDHTILAEGVNCYCMNRVILHERTVVSQRVFLCGGDHDIRSRQLPLVTKPIEIGPDAWVAAEAFIGPGSRISEGSVVGARAVVFKELDPWSVYAGNPAQKVSVRHLK